MAESVRCPHCGESVRCDAVRAGDPVDCPECDRSFLAPTRDDVRRSAPEAVGGAPLEVRSARADAPLAPTGLASLALTAVFYAGVVGPLGDTAFGAIFGARGWVPYVISFLSIWAGVLLAWKYRRLRAQSRVFALDLLPASIAERVTPATAPAFVSHLGGLPADLADGFLAQRIGRSLEHFRARADVREAVEQLRMQADRDEAAVESSFTMLRVFIWAIPILGFIGTVIGIGQSVGGFSESVAAASDLDVMKDSIGAVTSGLGIAFDTTLLALVMSIFIMFPTSSLQKAEEDFLTRVDEYCQRHLVARLDDGASGRGADGEADAVVARVADRLATRLLAALDRQSGGKG